MIFNWFIDLWYILGDPWDEDIEEYEGKIELEEGEEIVAIYIKN